MKNMFESGEVFALYAQIDCCYWLVGNIQKELARPKDPIYRMIDDQTGYTAARTKELTEQVIDLVEQIIDCKKKIKADASMDRKMLKALKNLTPPQ